MPRGCWLRVLTSRGLRVSSGMQRQPQTAKGATFRINYTAGSILERRDCFPPTVDSGGKACVRFGVRPTTAFPKAHALEVASHFVASAGQAVELRGRSQGPSAPRWSQTYQLARSPGYARLVISAQRGALGSREQASWPFEHWGDSRAVLTRLLRPGRGCRKRVRHALRLSATFHAVRQMLEKGSLKN